MTLENRLRQKGRYYQPWGRLAGLLLILIGLSGCVGIPETRDVSASPKERGVSETPQPIKEEHTFQDVATRDWELSGVEVNGNPIEFNRQELRDLAMEDAYTLRFDDFGVVGKAAPNRYRGTYEAEDKGVLTISDLVSTRIANLVEPTLDEYDYYQYLSWVNQWELFQGRLILYAETPEGMEIRLTYEEAPKER